MKNYYEDTTHISHSMLQNFVSYNEYWNVIYTPDDFELYSIQWIEKSFSNEDIIEVWHIVDEYFEKWPNILNRYEVVSRRSDEPNQITKSMKEDIDRMIELWNNFNRFQIFIKNKDTKAQEILLSKLNIDNENIKIKWKPDFINYKEKRILDLKTSKSRDNFLKSIFYKWQLNIYAKRRMSRQLIEKQRNKK